MRFLNYPLTRCPKCNHQTLNAYQAAGIHVEICVARSHFAFGSCDYQEADDV